MPSESPTKSTFEGAGQFTKPSVKHIFEGHEGTIFSIVFLRDNVHVVSGSEDDTMRKWNCDTGLLVGEPWKGEGGRVFALALSPDGKTIACGRADGSVQRWNTDGEMIEDVWTGGNGRVRSLSWSPSGSHLASGYEDGSIVIRKAESGEVDVVGPIKTGQDWVRSLAYSPLGDRIAAGGWNQTICIWDSQTGELVVGPIENLGEAVTSLVWSLDGTRIYSASDKIARVFDSVSGQLLHRLNHPSFLYSVALSPKGNVLACVGTDGIGQLWDTETHQLGQPFRDSLATLHFVLFSQDGRYIACGGDDKNLTLWIANETAPKLAVSDSTTIEDAAPEEEETRTRPESTSSSYLDRDAKNPRARPGDHEGEGNVDPYKNFFRSSKTSLALASSDSDPQPPHRRFWTFVIRSRNRPSEEKIAPTKDRHKRSLFPRRAREKSLLQVPAATDSSESKVQEGEHIEESCNIVDCSGKSLSDARNKKDGKGKQREDSLTDTQTPSPDHPPPATGVDLDSSDNRKRWNSLMRHRGKDPISAANTPEKKHRGPSSQAVVVPALRHFQRSMIMPLKRKQQSHAATSSTPPVADASGPQGLSSHVDPV